MDKYFKMLEIAIILLVLRLSIGFFSMIVKKGIEIRLYPNKGQRNFINKMIGATRVVYNTILFRRQEYYKANRKSLKVLPTELYADYPWIKELDSQGLSNTYMNLMQAYDNFFTYLKKKKQGIKNLRKVGLPEFKSKHSKSGSYRNAQPIKDKYKLINLQNHTIKLPKLKYVKFKGNIDLDRIIKIYNVTIKKTNTNKYFCSICCDYEVPTFAKTDKSIGLDLGVRTHIMPSYGKPYENKHFLKNSEKKIKHLQQELSRKKKGSKNYEKARLKLAIAHEKLSNRRKDYIQKTTTKIVKENDIICIEDLNVSGMMQDHSRAKGIADVSFYAVRSMLDYKCRWYGKRLVIIDRWYPSSKTCGNCGYVYKELGDEDKWICPSCGMHHDRDLNAARNILNEGLKSIKSLNLNKQIPLGRREFKPCGGQEVALASKGFSETCLSKQEDRKLVSAVEN